MNTLPAGYATGELFQAIQRFLREQAEILRGRVVLCSVDQSSYAVVEADRCQFQRFCEAGFIPLGLVVYKRENEKVRKSTRLFTWHSDFQIVRLFDRICDEDHERISKEYETV